MGPHLSHILPAIHVWATSVTHTASYYILSPTWFIFKMPFCSFCCEPGSSVGIATDYGLDGPGSKPVGDEIFRPSRPALWHTQPHVKWVLGLSPAVKCGRGMLLTTHPLLVPRAWKSRVIPLPTLWGHTGPVTGSLYLYTFQ